MPRGLGRIMEQPTQQNFKWGIIVTIVIAAVSWIGSGIMASYRVSGEVERRTMELRLEVANRMTLAEGAQRLEKLTDYIQACDKVNEVKVAALETEFEEYREDRALWRGEVNERLVTIERMIVKIDAKLDKQ